ncbi:MULTISPECIES: hypothetical protein [unclassified Xanthobacter]|uniref:hypothetical protein n=1 Tax=unclassified Xanthobacter TaxID=2623496 RepID=UPI001F21B3B7|nr:MULTISPECIES: hypothetical protein [unclassified Xanthobacter]
MQQWFDLAPDARIDLVQSRSGVELTRLRLREPAGEDVQLKALMHGWVVYDNGCDFDHFGAIGATDYDVILAPFFGRERLAAARERPHRNPSIPLHDADLVGFEPESAVPGLVISPEAAFRQALRDAQGVAPDPYGIWSTREILASADRGFEAGGIFAELALDLLPWTGSVLDSFGTGEEKDRFRAAQEAWTAAGLAYRTAVTAATGENGMATGRQRLLLARALDQAAHELAAAGQAVLRDVGGIARRACEWLPRTQLPGRVRIADRLAPCEDKMRERLVGRGEPRVSEAVGFGQGGTLMVALLAVQIERCLDQGGETGPGERDRQQARRFAETALAELQNVRHVCEGRDIKAAHLGLLNATPPSFGMVDRLEDVMEALERTLVSKAPFDRQSGGSAVDLLRGIVSALDGEGRLGDGLKALRGELGRVADSLRTAANRLCKEAADKNTPDRGAFRDQFPDVWGALVEGWEILKVLDMDRKPEGWDAGLHAGDLLGLAALARQGAELIKSFADELEIRARQLESKLAVSAAAGERSRREERLQDDSVPEPEGGRAPAQRGAKAQIPVERFVAGMTEDRRAEILQKVDMARRAVGMISGGKGQQHVPFAGGVLGLWDRIGTAHGYVDATLAVSHALCLLRGLRPELGDCEKALNLAAAGDADALSAVVRAARRRPELVAQVESSAEVAQVMQRHEVASERAMMASVLEKAANRLPFTVLDGERPEPKDLTEEVYRFVGLDTSRAGQAAACVRVLDVTIPQGLIIQTRYRLAESLMSMQRILGFEGEGGLSEMLAGRPVQVAVSKEPSLDGAAEGMAMIAKFTGMVRLSPFASGAAMHEFTHLVDYGRAPERRKAILDLMEDSGLIASTRRVMKIWEEAAGPANAGWKAYALQPAEILARTVPAAIAASPHAATAGGAFGFSQAFDHTASLSVIEVFMRDLREVLGADAPAPPFRGHLVSPAM